MTNENGPTYTWNAEEQITVAGGVTYTYDGDGLRVKKSNGKLYWRSIGIDVLAETDLAGNNPVEFIYFAGQRVAARDAAGQDYYIFSDHLGSARVITNATGTVCGDEDYLPFGAEKVTATCWVNYKFAGYERDPETGLDYATFRYYNSRLGRFMSPDLLSGGVGDPQSLNRYAYVLNDPVNLTDPLGLECQGATTGAGTPVGDQTPADFTFTTTGSAPCPTEGGWGDGWGPPGGDPTQGFNGLAENPPPPLIKLQLAGGATGDRSGGDGFTLGLRQEGETFGQCMQQHAQDYSVAGAADLVLGTNLKDNAFASFFLGNSVNGVIWGVFGNEPNAGEAASGAAAVTWTEIAGAGAGSALTYGRRTTQIMALNLAGKSGGPARALARTGAKGALGTLGTILLAGDAAFIGAEAIGCLGPR